ncbi:MULTISPECIES: hypothetical protein [unclassified Caballeronia]|uniref:hypothetical protein n=1 Tax=unclassified Caballeronia TaxID=2646786 RepID=UPI0020299716|nr:MULTISPECIES: hypothetical protein [unclassified Caballeronia]
MTEDERIMSEETAKCPLTQAKRARQKRSRELVESGQCTPESMFLIAPEIARTLVLTRRTDDF